jgi:predicted TIM-barrel fold metal-dependent hydrolase
MGYIDAHVHVWTPDTNRYPLAKGFSKANMMPPSFTPEQLFAHCKPEGVDRIVLIQMSFYGLDNSYMLDCMKRHPGVFGGVGIVDVTADKPDQAMAELARHGVRGFRVRPSDPPDPKWMETPGYERMFLFAADRKLAICPLIDPRALPSLSRMCARFPHTRVVIDHFCRIGLDGEIRDADVAALCKMADFPEVRVKISAFYALGKKRPPHEDLVPMFKKLHAAFGAKRLMWASDCPFQVDNETYRDSISLVRDRSPWLTAEEREWLLRKTAEEVYF